MDNKKMFRSKFKGLSKLFLILIFSIILSLPGSVYGQGFKLELGDLDYLFQTIDLLDSKYAYDISSEELLEGLMKGLFYNLDDNSQYYTKKELQSLMGDISGNLVGVGVYLREENGQILVDALVRNGPAEVIGVKTGDIITSVDRKNIEGMPINDVVPLITGKANSQVILGIKRDGKKDISFNISRKVIELNPIEYGVIQGNIGYLKVNQFTEYSHRDIELALEKFDEKEISNIVIDLRNNPGGFLNEAIRISQLFIPEGPIVHVNYKNNIKKTHYSNLKEAKYNIAVLINENSASASEIFAGAVQDSKVGTVIGATSYGKGTVQQIIPLAKGDGIKLTVAEYLTPKGRNVNNIGIVPDIAVKNNDGKIDRQLQKAVEVLSINR